MKRHGEIRALTSLRGVAAITVATYHFILALSPSLPVILDTHFFQMSWLWVDFFFILSGFVIQLAYGKTFSLGVKAGDYGYFMQRRLARVYPLHVFMLGCFVVTELAKFVIPSNADPAFSHNTGHAIIAQLLLIQAWHLYALPNWDGPSWSISAEFAAYLVFPLFAMLLARWRRTRDLAGLALVAYGSLILLKVTLGHGTLFLMSDYGVLRCVPSFVIGMVIACALPRLSARTQWTFGSDAFLATALIAAILGLHWGAPDILIVPIFALIILSAALNTGRVSRALSIRPLYALGVISYSIYLTNWLVERAWHLVAEKLFGGIVQPTTALASLFLLLAMTIAVSWLTYRLVELPGRRIVAGAARLVSAHDELSRT